MNNVITGNGAANTLTSGAGSDTLTGGGGGDTFLFNQADIGEYLRVESDRRQIEKEDEDDANSEQHDN